MTVDISNLVLLRNDPEEAARLLADAEMGDIDAQYAMGLIYAEGRGIEQDDSLSFMWLTLAGDRGDSEALKLRNIVAARMSDTEHQRALDLLDKRHPFDGSPAMRAMRNGGARNKGKRKH